ncbi:hypothetical protein BN903_389 [Halorubrum sp. AJ67]|nr:hypothetical protein BN903_389 [Halorubrum sp. AJ67]
MDRSFGVEVIPSSSSSVSVLYVRGRNGRERLMVLVLLIGNSQSHRPSPTFGGYKFSI